MKTDPTTNELMKHFARVAIHSWSFGVGLAAAVGLADTGYQRALYASVAVVNAVGFGMIFGRGGGGVTDSTSCDYCGKAFIE